eukprot:TRINITY_DN715_c0_g1_i1.p1 TRINITY_DN715_c0_g1~~TRINITY_DN715_c0_g1_i1.p1  ORF type:complete len:837 (-),score=243.89 TRINITY_DN715_c0_g1_i1:63-2573(-)
MPEEVDAAEEGGYSEDEAPYADDDFAEELEEELEDDAVTDATPEAEAADADAAETAGEAGDTGAAAEAAADADAAEAAGEVGDAAADAAEAANAEAPAADEADAEAADADSAYAEADAEMGDAEAADGNLDAGAAAKNADASYESAAEEGAGASLAADPEDVGDAAAAEAMDALAHASLDGAVAPAIAEQGLVALAAASLDGVVAPAIAEQALDALANATLDGAVVPAMTEQALDALANATLDGTVAQQALEDASTAEGADGDAGEGGVPSDEGVAFGYQSLAGVSEDMDPFEMIASTKGLASPEPEGLANEAVTAAAEAAQYAFEEAIAIAADRVAETCNTGGSECKPGCTDLEEEEAPADGLEEESEGPGLEGRLMSRASTPEMPRISVEEFFANPPTEAEMELKRTTFEGIELSPAENARRQMKKRGKAEKYTEADRLKQMMREKGEGNITIAWRRYFDSDGDGSLSFMEFVDCLSELDYKGDTPALFVEIGNGAKELELWMLDPIGAEILDAFGDWCHERLGGPYEVFQYMDDDGSDSLSREEFCDGLEELGFFEHPGLPSSIDNKEGVAENLYPLLDKGGFGCVQAEQFLFLERDKEKKDKLNNYLQRLREFGHDGAPDPLPNEAPDFLHDLAFRHTSMGGKHYGLLQGECLEMACGPRRGQPRLLEVPELPPWPRRQLSAPCLETNVTRGRQRALKLPKPGSDGSVSYPTGRRRVSGWGGGNQRLLNTGGFIGPGVPRTKQNPRLEPRAIYTRTMVPPLPPMEESQPSQKLSRSSKLPAVSVKPAKAAKGPLRFDPRRSSGEDFFKTASFSGLFHHYDSVKSMKQLALPM